MNQEKLAGARRGRAGSVGICTPECPRQFRAGAVIRDGAGEGQGQPGAHTRTAGHRTAGRQGTRTPGHQDSRAPPHQGTRTAGHSTPGHQSSPGSMAGPAQEETAGSAQDSLLGERRTGWTGQDRTGQDRPPRLVQRRRLHCHCPGHCPCPWTLLLLTCLAVQPLHEPARVYLPRTAGRNQ